MTAPETIAAQRLAKLREAVEARLDSGVIPPGRFDSVADAAIAYISALTQPAPETKAKCAERCSDRQVIEWRDRHNLKLILTDARCAFEDAATVQPERQPNTAN